MKTFTHSKKALVLCMLSIVLCTAMLAGTTLAWFTDGAQTGANRITAGNLDIALQYSTDGVNYVDATDATDIFAATDLWEPGFTKVVYFKVINQGNLAVEYKVGTNIVKNVLGKNRAGEAIDLTNYIQFGIVETATPFAATDAGRAQAREAIQTPVNFSAILTGEKVLLGQGDESVFAMVAWMPETVGNEANHNGVDVPSIDFGVHVIATQYAAENDSMNNQYDADAQYPAIPRPENIVVAAGTAEELAEAIHTALAGGSASGVITINLEKDFDVKGEWVTPTDSNYSGVNNVVINGNGHTIKNLNDSLLSGVFGGSDGSLTINNLTIQNATINRDAYGTLGLGAFISYADSSNKIVLNGCKLKDSSLTMTDGGTAVGGLIGYSSAATVEILNCEVTGTTINGKNASSFIGHAQSALTISNCTSTGNTFNGQYAGVAFGTANGTSAAINRLTQSENNISNLYGRHYTTLTVDGEPQA